MRAPSTPVRNALAYAVPELFWGATWALTIDGPMVAAYRDAFDGSEAFVGVTWLLAAAALAGLGLCAAAWVEPLRHKRMFVFWGHVAGGVAMLLTAVGIRLLAPHGSGAACAVYLVGVTLFFLTVGVLLPGWLALVGELFEGHARARVLGVTFVCNRLGAMLAGHYVAGAVLRSDASAVDQWTLLFALAGAAGVVGSVPFLWIVEVPRPRPARTTLRRHFAALRAAVRELPALRRFIRADMVGIALVLTLAWYADAAIQRDGFRRYHAGDWVTIGAFAQMVTSGLVAATAARLGPRGWFLIGTLGGVTATLGAAVGGNELAYQVAAAGIGVYMGVRASCHAPLVMGLAPGRDGTAPIGVAVAAIMVVQGLGPPIGAYVVHHAGYPPVFVAVAVCGVVSGILLLLHVPADVGTRVDAVHPPDGA